MKIKQTSGHVVHSPLSYSFQMIEKGGSYVQKYDVMSDSYVPNRAITPYVLQPCLIISDPDGTLATADYTSQLVNVSWTMEVVEGAIAALLTVGKAFSADTKALTIDRNVEPGKILRVSFSADYLDKRRGDVQHFEWEKDIITEAQSDVNLSLDTGRWRSKVRLSPFKNWGQFSIPVQLKHGDDAVADADAVYQWQWWDSDTKAWSEDFSEQPWLVSGEKTKQITVDQDYIQNVLLRVKASHKKAPMMEKYFCTRLRRWYGQFDYDVEFLTGKYVFHDTNMVVLNAWVANRSGNIANISKYFDVELFFAVGNNDFESVGYGEEAIIRRSDLQEGKPSAGMLCRELSAFTAIADDDGNVLTEDDDTPIFAQFPVKTREV